MDSVFFQTLLSRALQDDGWLATVSDAPLPLHFIGGASVAHVSCIHFNWGGVAMHLIYICIVRHALARSWGFHTLILGAGTGRRTYCCLMPGRLLVGDTTPTVLWLWFLLRESSQTSSSRRFCFTKWEEAFS
ncbi:hypothetical protein EVAR_82422_1 [Eumeta japonica]|uniref:Uncharacterized protein n=1 Tax=Eumeta variegata TaxID=151549 RepID=A0A4C1YJ48_EUMVA|nr:hypothetical protein EVAR_82422_1 [Eumeta japonica]